MSSNKVVCSSLGPSAALPILGHLGQPALINSPPPPWSPLLASIICAFAPGTVATYNIEFSNDSVNFVPDANATGLTAPIIYATGAYSLYWRLNVTSYTSGAVTAAYGAP